MTEQHQAQIAQLKKDLEADKQIALGLQNTQLVRWQQVGCEKSVCVCVFVCLCV